ncbi:MAG: High-affinity branched-chain amino acid transport system permease protein LivH [Planctomycetes bacterium]|nr:High-affinity branched-chain amino acid transport system permease protein LivH [Planctomycetota bacterium]
MIQTLWDGFVQGALYAVVALGYTMVYGILMLINFAHGEVMMLGAYAGVVTLAGLAGSGAMASLGLPLCLCGAVLASMGVAACYGFVVERVAYRPLRGAGSLSPLISAIGVSIVLQNFVMLTQGNAPIYVPGADKAWQDALTGGWTAGPLSVQPTDALIVAVCVLLMAGLWLFVQKTRIGTAMRATSQDRVMARLVGIDVDRVISATFVIGSALAAVAGVLTSLLTMQAKFDMGFLLGMKAFVAAVLGGIGNIPGAMLGGLLLGLVEAAGIYGLRADYKDVYAFGLLLVVLIARPRGLLGERVAEKV